MTERLERGERVERERRRREREERLRRRKSLRSQRRPSFASPVGERALAWRRSRDGSRGEAAASDGAPALRLPYKRRGFLRQ